MKEVAKLQIKDRTELFHAAAISMGMQPNVVEKVKGSAAGKVKREESLPGLLSFLCCYMNAASLLVRIATGGIADMSFPENTFQFDVKTKLYRTRFL